MANSPEASELHPEDAVIQSEAERYLFAEFSVGSDVEHFLNTEAGRYLKGVAEQEIADAVRVFLNNDTRRSIDLVAQARVKALRSRQAFHWMLEAIQDGRIAEQKLREMDDLDPQ